MSFPKQFMDEIRTRINLSEVIGSRIKITRKGHEFSACCPFHKEKTPSFTINDQKGFYHCFGCGVHGDVISFLMEHDNIPFPEAIEALALKAGLEVPQQTPQDIQKFKKQTDLYKLLDCATKWFEKQLRLPQHNLALSYLKNRGLSDETLSLFRIGYAPEDGAALRKEMIKQGFTDKNMIDVGLLRLSSQSYTGANKDPYSFFRGRVMFPVSDLRSRVVAYGGRILPEQYQETMPRNNTSFKPPKYINSSETVLFHKGKMLYAQDLARSAYGKGVTPIVVEGYMDVISLHQAGVEGAVAPLGTALTEQQIEHLWHIAPENNRTPILCFDGDNAGRRAAIRALDNMLTLLKPDHSARFAFLPDGEDPDSIVQKGGRKALDDIVKHSSSLFDLLWAEETQSRRLDAPEVRAGLQKALEKRISVIADRTVQGFYSQEVKQRIYQAFRGNNNTYKKNQNYTAQKNWYNKNQKAQNGIKPLHIKTSPVNQQKYTLAHIFLAAFVNYPEIFPEYSESFSLFNIENQNLKALRGEIFNILEENNKIESPDALKDMLIQKGYATVLEVILSESLYLQAVFVRPGHDLDFVREGWTYTWDRAISKKNKNQ